jgi:hypothetical protein
LFLILGRLHLKCDGTRTETRFYLSAKRTSPFKSAGASVQPTTGSRGVGLSGSNAGYTKFRGSEGYWLPTPFASFPFTSPPLRHRVPSRFNWTVPRNILHAFAELRKATVGFVTSVRPSEWNDSASTERILIKYYIWVFFENLSRKFNFY